MALKYTKPPGYPPIISEASSKNSGSNFSPTTASNYGIFQEVEIHGEPNVSITDCVIPIKQDQVRWFYRDRDKYWQPFCGSDSLRLEQSFSMNQCITGNDKVLIPVMGDMYEVNLYKKTLMPIYWDLYGKQTFVMRSWWFEVINDNWYPFEERNLTILERTHKSVLEAEKCGNISTKDPKSPQFKVQIDDSEVIWQCSTDVRRCKLDIASRILGFKGNQVKRGYKILATLTDTLPPIGHIVFVLHGVGQAMEGASIIKCTDSVRELSKSLIDKYFPSKSMSSRVEFFPVNWRTLLLLDNGFVSKITLSDAKGFRNILNLSVGDVMYYTSAKFGPEILDSLLMQLNNLYGKFIERNPEFQSRGKVSILAHSLGSVVMYDALYSCIPRADHLQAMDETEKSKIEDELRQLEKRAMFLREKLSIFPSNHLFDIFHHPVCSSKKLLFQVEHFFAIGSPLAIFISLRNFDHFVDKKHKSSQALFPYEICKRFYNIFHPADPVTYRIEPLISHIYSQVRPVRIDNASLKPSQEATIRAMGPYLPQIPNSSPTSNFLSLFYKVSTSSTNIKQISGETINPNTYLEKDDSLSFNEKLTERLDFALKEGILESSHLNFLTAHTGYWESRDTILFILLQIFNFVPSPMV